AIRVSAFAMVVTLAAGVSIAARHARQVREDVPLHHAFSDPSHLAEWDLDGSGQWTIANGLLILAKAGAPTGPIRRPAALAILKSPPMARVTVEAQIRSTAALDVVNRDLEIVFGYESPARFYYVHL